MLFFVTLLISVIAANGARQQRLQQPSACFSQDTFENFIACMFQFLLQQSSITPSSVQSIPPTPQQRQDMQSTIQNMLTMGDQQCTQIRVPTSIADSYTVQVFTERSTGVQYCVLYCYAVDPAKQSFARGWGLFSVINTKSAIKRQQVHLSACHPITDGPVHSQAAAMFKAIGAGSLHLATQRRDAASPTPSSCEGSGSDGTYYSSDGCHDNNTMFNTIQLAIGKYQQSLGCPHEVCTFLQFHGKALNSCAAVSQFLSAGLSRKYPDFYANQNLPVSRLQRALVQANPQWTPKTPGDDTCHLSADDNVFGRWLNGVPLGSECHQGSNAAIASGMFLHCEQEPNSRLPAMYPQWTRALNMAFGVSCAPGFQADQVNGLCTAWRG